MIYLGYAPGGSARIASKSGVAILTVTDQGRRYETESVTCVDDALLWFADRLGDATPEAAGIDAPLFWETSRCGWRAVDRWLKQTYSAVARSVLPANSVQGSLAIQGMSMGIVLRRRWPRLTLTETHPKLLYHALTGNRHSWSPGLIAWLRGVTESTEGTSIRTDNEWSALMSAWVAMMGHSRAWSVDLRQRSQTALEPAGAVTYWWPLVADGVADTPKPTKARPLQRFVGLAVEAGGAA